MLSRGRKRECLFSPGSSWALSLFLTCNAETVSFDSSPNVPRNILITFEASSATKTHVGPRSQVASTVQAVLPSHSYPHTSQARLIHKYDCSAKAIQNTLEFTKPSCSSPDQGPPKKERR
ncbi:hypothetical protein EV426DRAFT_611660 [Tirmania nivea]|nr:hypothetical protein EV426DRAFT_611660 [Tirmania nivea]